MAKPKPQQEPEAVVTEAHNEALSREITNVKFTRHAWTQTISFDKGVEHFEFSETASEPFNHDTILERLIDEALRAAQ